METGKKFVLHILLVNLAAFFFGFAGYLASGVILGLFVFVAVLLGLSGLVYWKENSSREV